MFAVDNVIHSEYDCRIIEPIWFFQVRERMNKVPVAVTGVSVYAPYQGYVVILKENGGKKWLPIFIGFPEAIHINRVMQDGPNPRPLTYDLFQSILNSLDAKINEVVITHLRDKTFYAEVIITDTTDKTLVIDARPSDAIALALKSNSPLLVNAEILEEAGLEGVEEIEQEAELRLKILNQQLNEAVEQEDYEDAAKLRDMIIELQHSEGDN